MKLAQPIRQLEELLAETQQQQPMNYTSANVAFLKDSLVRERALEAMERLPRSERMAFVEAQLAWRAERLTAVRAAAAVYEGGSLASYAGNAESIRWSEERLEALEAVGR